ncbi:MAG: DUF3617 family protein [Betaproteobacteria bacterium]
MKFQSVFLAAGSVLLALSAQAQGPTNLKPGQYEYTTKTEMFGMSIPVSFKQCVTQKDVESNNAYVNRQGMDGCTPPDVKRNGAEISVKYTCSKPKMTGEGSGTVSEDSFNFDMKVVQHEMNNSVVRTKLTAKRLGDCK